MKYSDKDKCFLVSIKVVVKKLLDMTVLNTEQELILCWTNNETWAIHFMHEREGQL